MAFLMVFYGFSMVFQGVSPSFSLRRGAVVAQPPLDDQALGPLFHDDLTAEARGAPGQVVRAHQHQLGARGMLELAQTELETA